MPSARTFGELVFVDFVDAGGVDVVVIVDESKRSFVFVVDVVVAVVVESLVDEEDVLGKIAHDSFLVVISRSLRSSSRCCCCCSFKSLREADDDNFSANAARDEAVDADDVEAAVDDVVLIIFSDAFLAALRCGTTNRSVGGYPLADLELFECLSAKLATEEGPEFDVDFWRLLVGCAVAVAASSVGFLSFRS